ncbi:unnamed protein product [Candidula unifasciata]|uniref:G-protein coupled receptor GRL101 n=1 Tax=Candidula unifasciata TaxID=100452 RepID=A0A8S4A3W1_9EUPU|nr:unnamed protein product [Candidula unifasciata]
MQLGSLIVICLQLEFSLKFLVCGEDNNVVLADGVMSKVRTAVPCSTSTVDDPDCQQNTFKGNHQQTMKTQQSESQQIGKTPLSGNFITYGKILEENGTTYESGICLNRSRSLSRRGRRALAVEDPKPPLSPQAGDTDKSTSSENLADTTYVRDDNRKGYYCYGMTDLLYETSKYFPTQAIPHFTGIQMSTDILIQNRTHCQRPSRLSLSMATVLNVTVETCCISWCTHEIEISVNENEHILFNFLQFNVPGLNLASSEAVGVCDESLDILVDHVGEDTPPVNNTPAIGSFCGIKAPKSVFVEYSKAKLVLTLKDNAQCVDKINFQVQIVPCLHLSYKSCDSSEYVKFERNHGYISSPGLAHGQNYPNDLHCVWKISVPEGQLIRLEASEIRLRDGDMIQISPKHANSRPFPEILKYSDHHFRQPVVLPSNECTVEFHSDSIKSGVGFNITYTAVNSSNFIPMFNNNSLDCSSGVHIPRIMRCNFYIDCANGEDEEGCPYKEPSCWPQGYAMNGRCYQIIVNKHAMSWRMAEEFCERNLSSHLISVSTEARRKSVDKLREFIGPSLSVIFLGLQRMRMQQVTQMYRRMWQWTDGSTAFYLPDEYRYEGWSTCSLFYSDYFHSTDCGTIKENVSFICEREMRSPKVSKANGWTPGRDSVDSTVHKLKVGVFHCHSGEYISTEQRCDKIENCFDRSDEVDCDYDRQVDSMYSCDSIGLLAFTFVCDGISECPDASDENWCRVPDKAALGLTMTTCTDGMTMQRSRLCDGKEDCRDASDEEDCTECVGGSELCPMIACLPQNWTTDNEIDCPIRDLKGRRAPETVFVENVFKTQPPPGVVVPDGYGKFMIQALPRNALCPQTHVQCSDGYCIPVYMWCNGIIDCPHGEDERPELCQQVCANMYRCKYSRTCVHNDHLCDGYYQCPNHDDEHLCSLQNVTCPQNCTCQRMEVTCSGYPTFESLSPVRYLKLQHAQLNDLHFNNLTPYTLIYLNVSSCAVRNIKDDQLSFLNLRILDISNNLIEFLPNDIFEHCPVLKVLIFSQNKLNNVNFTFLEHARALTKLDLSFNVKVKLEDDAFSKAFSLEELHLRYMQIETISNHAFRGLSRLRRLDLKGNPIMTFSVDIFHFQKNLRSLVTDNFRLCCSSIKPSSVQFVDCDAPYDEISSCEDILRTLLLRVALWLMAVLTISGNFGVIVYRIFFDRGIKLSFRVIITCLSASDLIMGIYLVIIGTADVMYRDRYLLSEREWKTSAPCQVAGFLCVLSSETSAMFILLVTVDRFLAITFPLHRALHFNAKSASIACAIVWTVGLSIATVPLLPPFRHWQLYSQKAVGVPLPITRFHFPGYDYAFAIFIVFNMAIFLLVALGQLLIYLSVHLQKHPQISEAGVRQDTAIAKRLVLVVLTDCLCWFPITVMGLVARSGRPVPGEMYLVTTIFLLPVNSAFNPFLYTANSIVLNRRNRRKKVVPDGSYGLRQIYR